MKRPPPAGSSFVADGRSKERNGERAANEFGQVVAPRSWHSWDRGLGRAGDRYGAGCAFTGEARLRAWRLCPADPNDCGQGPTGLLAVPAGRVDTVRHQQMAVDRTG